MGSRLADCCDKNSRDGNKHTHAETAEVATLTLLASRELFLLLAPVLFHGLLV